MAIDVCNEFELLTTYTHRKKVLFASQLENQSVLTDGYVANTNQGFTAVFQALALDPVFPNPITLLRPLIAFDFTDKECCIRSISFRAFRTKLRTVAISNVSLTNQLHQVTGNDIAGPITLNVPAYLTAGTLTNQFPQYNFEEVKESWQPNYFRPQITVNGMDIMGNSTPSFFSPNTNAGDRSIGWELPYKEKVFKFFPGGIGALQVYGLVAQAIAPAFTTFERFCLTCEIDVLWK